jgi:hypothetical protein
MSSRYPVHVHASRDDLATAVLIARIHERPGLHLHHRRHSTAWAGLTPAGLFVRGTSPSDRAARATFAEWAELELPGL